MLKFPAVESQNTIPFFLALLVARATGQKVTVGYSDSQYPTSINME
jgi:hypothetical protein